jgi:ferritin-like metal-binding protein YciE
MAAKEKGLEDLFLATLKDVYYAEKQILRALPKMAKAAESDELRQAFEKHRAETEGHVERLEEVFEAIGKKAQGKTCEAIQGIIEEGKEIMEDFAESEALDAGLIAAAQAVEHYEISRYGTLRTWAQELGLRDAVGLLEETLAEEKKTDQLLSHLAEPRANQRTLDAPAPRRAAPGRRRRAAACTAWPFARGAGLRGPRPDFSGVTF